ncbi:MAG: hypothetical protein AAFU64_16100 [Bacteroidota bacterium]
MFKSCKWLLIIFLFLSLACQSDDPSQEELEARIERLKTDIGNLIDLSTGRNSDDCRTRVILGGDGCGPVYVYGIQGIDTLQLENLFLELGATQDALFALKGGPICSIAIPNLDSLIEGQCRACYLVDTLNNLECF